MDRRCHDRRSRQTAILGQRGIEAKDGSGNPRRAPTAQARARDHAPAAVEVHVGTSGAWRGLTEVDEDISAICEVSDEKAATPDIAAARVRHSLRVANRDRGVDCVATGAQYFGSGFRREMLRRYDHEAIGLDGQW